MMYFSFFYLRVRVFEDSQAIFKRTYATSNDRTIPVSPLKPGKTYITVLVAGDGIRSETKSDPQLVTTLGKGLTGVRRHALEHSSNRFRSRSTCGQLSLVHRSARLSDSPSDHSDRRLCPDAQQRWHLRR